MLFTILLRRILNHYAKNRYYYFNYYNNNIYYLSYLIYIKHGDDNMFNIIFTIITNYITF